jgi:hypothetical protein
MGLTETLKNHAGFIGSGLTMITFSGAEGFMAAKGVPPDSFYKTFPGMVTVLISVGQAFAGERIGKNYSDTNQRRNRAIGLASGLAISIAEMGIGYYAGYAIGKLTD